MVQFAKNPMWAELIQLVPIVSFALPFIVKGEVDLSRAQQTFLLAAVLTIPATFLVTRRGLALNPILVGTSFWLWVAAIAFNAHLDSASAWLVWAQGAGFRANLRLGGGLPLSVVTGVRRVVIVRAARTSAAAPA